jgi:hypothetical protein
MAKNKHGRNPKAVLKLPDLEQSKSAVLNSLASLSTKPSSLDTVYQPRASRLCGVHRCGLGRAEVAALSVESLQQREEHWVIADMIGKGGHMPTVPVPTWVKGAVDNWVTAAGVRMVLLADDPLDEAHSVNGLPSPNFQNTHCPWTCSFLQPRLPVGHDRQSPSSESVRNRRG